MSLLDFCDFRKNLPCFCHFCRDILLFLFIITVTYCFFRKQIAAVLEGVKLSNVNYLLIHVYKSASLI